jgi:hypothetical protein
MNLECITLATLVVLYGLLLVRRPMWALATAAVFVLSASMIRYDDLPTLPPRTSARNAVKEDATPQQSDVEDAGEQGIEEVKEKYDHHVYEGRYETDVPDLLSSDRDAFAQCHE